ncbi:hypothetical protein PR202_ga08806 [Eleusine coracana subsp. coracana]|uniref:MLO-like protein n=1 Tax=Eleusine coracana subsp. coracana TaxID=191504 RepID=A0AAV5C175_ELECO|nr:hypothetical protein PR202_ga08806 [Eleusine coracana subsp. coracana]
MVGGGGEGEAALEFTPTWIVAAVCSLIVLISLAAERCLHYLGKGRQTLKGKNQKALFEALLKVKEELMLLGFISLLLTVFQGMIQRTCIPPEWTSHMLPCQNSNDKAALSPSEVHAVAARVLELTHRRLLPEGGPGAQHCQKKVVALSVYCFISSIKHPEICKLGHIFICGARIHQWKRWEDEIQKDVTGNGTSVLFASCIIGPKKVTHVHQFEFIREHFKGIGKDSIVLRWLHAFVKQFYGSVTKSDYTTMRFGFITTHCRANPKFDFHRYMVRALEADFKKVVGIRNFWHNYVHGHIPVANLQVGIHTSGSLSFPLLAIIQLLCSYSTLPLYAIVTQMGTFFKKEIFDEHVQQGLVGWAQKAKKRKALKNGTSSTAGSTHGSSHPSARLELMRRAVDLDEGSTSGEVQNARAPGVVN